MYIETEHKKTTLMHKTKEELIDYIMYLEHNNNSLSNRLDQQAENFKILEKQAYEQGRKDYDEELEKQYERKSRYPWI